MPLIITALRSQAQGFFSLVRGRVLQVYCVFLFFCAASLFGTLISQVNEIVAAQAAVSKELDGILEAYLSVEPRQSPGYPANLSRRFTREVPSRPSPGEVTRVASLSNPGEFSALPPSFKVSVCLCPPPFKYSKLAALPLTDSDYLRRAPSSPLSP